MDNCRNCGTKLESGALFCSECGTPINDSREPSQQPPSTQTWVAQTASQTNNYQPVKSAKKPLSKKQKIIYSSVIGIVIILFISFFILQKITSPEYKLEKFETALEEHDHSALKNLLSTSNDKLKIEEKHIKDLLTYLKENPSEKENIVYHLRNTISKGEILNYLDPNGPMIQFVKKGKTFLFFDNYEIQMRPYYIEITTDQQGTKIFLDNKEIGVAEDYTKKFGPVLPGTYQVKVVLEGGLVPLESTTEVNLFDWPDMNEVSIEVYLPGEDVTVETDFTDAEIFVNGKSAGKTDEYGVLEFGPVNTDGSIKMYAEKEFPWGKVKSEEVTIDSNYMDLDIPPLDEKQENEVAQFIQDFFAEYNQALKSLDAKKLSLVTDDFKTTISKDLNERKENEEKYVGEGFTKVKINLDSLSVEENESLGVVVEATQKGDFIYNDASKDDVDYYQSLEDEYGYYIHLYYDVNNKKWLVTNMDHTWAMFHDDTRVKELTITKGE